MIKFGLLFKTVPSTHKTLLINLKEAKSEKPVSIAYPANENVPPIAETTVPPDEEPADADDKMEISEAEITATAMTDTKGLEATENNDDKVSE